MKLPLKYIADIQPGFSFRGRIEPASDGEFRVIQIRDIKSKGRLFIDDLIRTNYSDIKSIYHAQKGDVLITTLGDNRRTAYISKEIPNTVFVSQISSLRTKNKKIEPAYLAWYLNQKPALRYFEAYATGSNIKNISLDDLKNMKIEVPPVEIQQKIVEIDRLHRRENELIEKIKTKRDQLIEQTLLNAIQEEK